MNKCYLLTPFLLIALLIVGNRQTEAALPSPGSPAMLELGYLNCDDYAGVTNNGTGDSTAGIQTCINDSQINSLAAFFPCGTYLIDETLTAYEFQNWDPAKSVVRGADPRVWQIVGSTINVAGGGEACRPEIKLIASTAIFNNAGAPRPMLIFRNFLGLNSSATTTTPPSNPYGLPATTPPGGYKEGQGNNFNTILRNMTFNTNGNAGAIGVTMMAPQSSGVYNTKVTATGSFSGFYGLPGQGGVAVNVEVVGGKHCILSGTININSITLGLGNTSGPVFAGVTCTNQTEEAIIIEDTASVTIAGLNVTKSTTGAAVTLRSPLALIDSRMSFSGAGLNFLAIDNNGADTMYGRNLWWSGTTDLARSGLASCTGCKLSATGMQWPWVNEYVHNDPFNKDGNNTVTQYPAYVHGGSGDKHFEVRSWIATETGLPVLKGEAFPIQQTPTDKGAAGPPADLLTRHVPASWPSFQDGPFTNPDDFGDCTPTVALQGLGNDAEDAGITGADCTAELQTAISNAASAGHNRVHLPRGVMAVSGTVTLGADTKLMGAGQGTINRITYKSTWLPTTETYYLTTANSATGTAYMGFFAMLVRTEPIANQQTAYYHWKVGKNSNVMGLQYSRENAPPDNPSQPLKLIRFSANGGGKHYGPNIYAYQLDSNTDMRMIYAEGTTQPLSFYGMDVEYTKAPSPAYTHANVEFRDGSNVRVYGCKREGNSPTGRIHNFTNIAVHGCGVMSVLLSGANQRYWQMTGTTNNILIAVQIVADMKAAATTSKFLSEDLTTPAGLRAEVPWPNGVAVYKRGQIDDSMFTGGSPPVTGPTFESAVIAEGVPDKITLCWFNPGGVAMKPAPPTAATGLTATVDTVSKTITDAQRFTNNCFLLTIAAPPLTSGSQVVKLSYAPGNMTGGGAGFPPAVAFTDITVDNQLNPTPVPLMTLAAYGFRSIFGLEDAVSSPWYTNSSGVFENVPASFIQGAQFRLRMKVANTTAAAPPQNFTVCTEQNESGTYTLLTNDCTTQPTCFADAPALGDGQVSTQQLTPVVGTFVPGALLESADTQVPITLPINSETDMEVALELSSTVPIGNRYRYRLCKAGGGPLNAHSNTPLVTVIPAQTAVRGKGSE